MYVAIAKRLDAGEIQEREEKEQLMIEATIRARANGGESAPIENTNVGFGSSLERHDVAFRSISRTVSDDSGLLDTNINNDIRLLRKLSLSSIDRQSLEQEMRAQHTHPLALQMETEAEERRIANEREYYRNNPQRSRDGALMRARMMGNESFRNRVSRINPETVRMMGARSGRRNWNEFTETTSLDDMVVLEAALLLSMEEESRSRSSDANGGSAAQHQTDMPDSSGSCRRFRASVGAPSLSAVLDSGAASSFSRGLTEDEQVQMAIALSMQEHQDKKDENGEADDNDGDRKPEASRGPPESAPSEAASVRSEVASLPIVSEDKDAGKKVQQKLPASRTGNLKSSDDDSAYFRMLEAESEEQHT